MSLNDSYPGHLVTAVIVAHDGAEWLTRVTSAVLGQTSPVHRIVAVDTGSRDRSGAVLAGLLGPDAVFGMDRGTGYGAAVTRALRYAGTPFDAPARRDVRGALAAAGGYRSSGAAERPVEWIWLLHDDCEPHPTALAELLRGAANAPGTAVAGPKVLDWSDPQVILEAGLAIDTAGRRISGTEPREIDQGQHDGSRDVLAVSSAGMLVRRDAWDQVGGFDPRLAMFREDVDFCWRVHAAGYRVRLVTDAVVYHLEASARGRREISAVTRPKRADRRHALIVLLANLPLTAMITALAGNAALSAARVLFFLLAKRPQAARDEAAALGALVVHPGVLREARRQRGGPGRRRAYGALRSLLPRGRSVRKLGEFAADILSPSSRAEAAGMHHASDDPSDDDSVLTDSGLAQRILANPGMLLFAALAVIAVVAERSLLRGGPLSGGALFPAWGGVSGLWREYLAGFHAVGVGSAASSPPYVAVIAAVATVLGGKPWLAVTVIMLGCVPFSGLTAYLAARRLTSQPLVRAWLGASYALLPVATGAVAAGRLGAAAAFVILPLVASAAAGMLTQGGRRARRSAWATGLLVAIAAAFAPLVWAVAVVVAGLAALVLAGSRRDMTANLAIVALVPPVLLAPWTLDVAEHPSMLLGQPGLGQAALGGRSLPASSLLLLNPGGPGTPPAWVASGLVVAALAALLVRGRGFGVAAAWGVALAGLLTAIVVSRLSVAPPGSGAAAPAWPGPALVVTAAGLLIAVAVVAEDVRGLLSSAGLRRLAAGGMVLVACAPPLLAAGYWMAVGVRGPLSRVKGPALPEFVAVSSDTGLRLRTLVLRPGHGFVGYAVLRGGPPPLGSDELTASAPAGRALDRVVSALVAPGGSDAGARGSALAQFAIGYVLMPAPVNAGIARTLDGIVGLRPVSQTSQFELWRVTQATARVLVTEPGGHQVPVSSGTVNVPGAPAPAAGGTLALAEPASASWHATLNGRPLAPLRSPLYGWAQGFRLPAGGGRLEITRDQTARMIAVCLELAALVVVAGLALPGAKEPAARAAAAAPARRAARQGHAGSPGAGNGQRHDRKAGRAGRGSRGAPAHGRPRRRASEGPADRGAPRPRDGSRDGGPAPGAPVPGSPVPGSLVSGSPVPGQPGPGSPVPGSPVPGSPVPDSPVPDSPVHGSPVPGGSVPGQPVPGGPLTQPREVSR